MYKYDAEVASALDAGLNGLPGTWDGQPAFRLPCILDSRGERAGTACARLSVRDVLEWRTSLYGSIDQPLNTTLAEMVNE